jgi:hypothetical protein
VQSAEARFQELVSNEIKKMSNFQKPWDFHEIKISKNEFTS